MKQGHMHAFAIAIILLLGVTTYVSADACSCSYQGIRPCAASISCPDPEHANCSCTYEGCSSSCGPSGPNQLNDVFDIMQINDMRLQGFSVHMDGKDSGWTIVTKTPLGAPLTLERITETYENLTLGELAEAIAVDFDLCVEIEESEMIIRFKALGTCS